jgi:predicted phosphohydrolase
MEEMKNMCNLVEKHSRKRSFGKLWSRYEHKIKMDFRGICSEDVDWIQLAQDMVQLLTSVNMVMKFHVLQKQGMS